MPRGNNKDEILRELIQRKWITITQAAVIVGVSRETMNNIRRRGQIRCIRVGGMWRIYEDEMVRFLLEGNYIEDAVLHKIRDNSTSGEQEGQTQ